MTQPAPSTTPYVYDVFISYRQREPDQSWARNVLVPGIEAMGLKVCIDYRDFRLGKLLIKEMERAVETSKYTLAVLSPVYLDSGFTELENVLSEQLGLEKGQRRLICVLYQPCQPRLSLRAHLWLDMSDTEKFTAGLPRLVSELQLSPEE